MGHNRTTAAFSYLLLAALLIFSFFYNLSKPPIFIWDEARRANDALQMYLRGDWIINYYDDNPQTWSVKSPILLLLQVGCMHLFGVGEFAIRFPSAFAAFTIGSVIWLFCTRYFGKPWIGFLSGSVFAATYAWVFNHAGRTGDYDALLTLFSFSYSICFYTVCINSKKRWHALFWLFLTAAVLIKGAAGLFFLPGLVVFTIVQKRFTFFLRHRLTYIGAACFVAVIGGYYAFREWYAPGFLAAVNGNELGGRYLTQLEGHGLNFFYYAKTIVAWRYTYWVGFLLLSFVVGFFHHSVLVRRLTLFNLVLTGPFFLIISSAQTKLSWYDLPLYPFWSIQIGLLLFYAWQWLQQKYLSHQQQWISNGTAIVLFLLLFALPLRTIFIHNQYRNTAFPWDVHAQERKQALFLQQAIQNNMNLNQHTFLYEDYDRHIHFYVKLLQSKDVNVQLVNTIDSIRPGAKVVVSEKTTAQKLQQQFEARPVAEKWDCTVYLIDRKKNDAKHLGLQKENNNQQP